MPIKIDGDGKRGVKEEISFSYPTENIKKAGSKAKKKKTSFENDKESQYTKYTVYPSCIVRRSLATDLKRFTSVK